MGARERTSQVLGVNVPDDRVGTPVNGTYCASVRSRTLKRLIGERPVPILVRKAGARLGCARYGPGRVADGRSADWRVCHGIER
jgi:hypothetical protein